MFWGGRNTTNKYHWLVWGVLAVYGSHWGWHSSRRHVLSRTTLLRVQVALQGYCPKQMLRFVHFPSLSCSDLVSRVLCKGTDSIGCAFCALPRSEQLRWPGTWWAHCSRWAVDLNHLTSPSHSLSWVWHESTISGVPCNSSGELISGCDRPGRCYQSRIPGRRG